MINFIDLFSGIGGIRLAFEKAGATCVLSSEVDEKARETYVLNFDEIPFGDVKELTHDIIPQYDILSAGFPCQPFSLAGFRKGFQDTRGTLFFEVARILKNTQPKAFLLENVAGIVNHDSGKTLSVIEETLLELGYDFRWKLMNAKDYGVPQNRNRWYCIGFKKSMNVSFTDEEVGKANGLCFEFPQKHELNKTINDIVSDIDSKDYDITVTAQKNIDIHIDKFIESKRYDENNVLIANEIRPSRCHFRSDGISPCLTAKMGTGGNNIPVVVSKARKLTEKECLEIMGFPKNFKIKRNSFHSYKQIGNSVAVPVVSLLADEIVNVIKNSNK